MTDCILKMEESGVATGAKREVLTLFDAWMDLRGHAASEDLILGNRSVAGFPLYLPGRKALSGYFFVSHPMPGLFYKKERGNLRPIESFVRTFRRIREQYEESLAMAVDMNIFADFAARSRPDGIARVFPVALGSGPEPLIDLSADDPSGYVATVLIPSGSSLPECAINEGAFARQLWSHAALLSFFPNEWQELTLSMEAYSDDFEKSGDCAVPFWDPQEYSENEDQRWRSVEPYYPNDVSRRFVPVSNGTPAHIDTSLHQRFKIFGRLYSSAHDPARDRCSQADLVIPLGCRASNNQVRSRIAGFIRINCDSLPKHLAAQYQQLYREVSNRYVGPLNDSLGRLLLLTDADLRWIHHRKDAGLFKQTYDAIRQLADWCAKCLAARGTLVPGSDVATERTGAPFSEALLKNVMGNVWKRLDNERPNLVNIAERSLLLRNAICAISELATALSGFVSVPFSLVTFWLRVWTPTVDSISGDIDQFVHLTMNDPGLLDVLQHVVLIPEVANRHMNLCDPSEREVSNLNGLLDLGYPHVDANVRSLRVFSSAQEVTDISWSTPAGEFSVSLRWSAPPDFKSVPRPIPAALAVVDGQVSDRIARNISSTGPITPWFTFNQLSLRVRLSDYLKDVDGNSPRFVENLEQLFIDDKDQQYEGSWTVLPLKRDERDTTPVGHLCILVPYCTDEESRPIVAAARNLSLGRVLAQFRAEAMERERGFALHQGAIAHNFRGSSGRLSNSIGTLLDLLGLADSSKDSVREGLREIQKQVNALGSLASDALYFSRTLFKRPVVTSQDLSILIDDVTTVQRAIESPFGDKITVHDQLSLNFPTLRPIYDPALFRHALARIMENALNAQNLISKNLRLVGVNLFFQVERRSICVQVFNTTNDANRSMEAILEALQGKTENSMGLIEAKLSCARSGLALGVDVLNVRGRQLVELSIEISVEA